MTSVSTMCLISSIKFPRSVDDIDLYTGGLSELHTSGAIVGPVFRCIIAKQFYNIRRSDRYWYENDMPETGFTKGDYE